MTSSPMQRATLAGRWLSIGIALLCFATAGGGMTTTDAVVAFDVTRNLVEHQSVSTTRDWLGNPAYRGRGDRYYSPFGIAQSVWNIPFYLAGRAATGLIGPKIGGADTLSKAAVALATIPAVALLGWTCFALLVELGAPQSRAAAIVLLLVFGTPLWPYSRFGFNQPLTGLFLWLAVLGAIAGVRGRHRGILVSGVSAGLAILTRHEMILPALVLGAWIGIRRAPRRWPAIRSYGAGLLPPLALWLALNWWRFGNPFESGYMRDPTPGFGSSILVGTNGLLFSPYASLLLYCPLVLLSVPALRAMWRRERDVAALFMILFCAGFGLYASLGNWMGGRSYGPRYLVPLLPALVLPLAFWWPARVARAVAVSVLVVSVTVQIPGVLVDYSKVRQQHAAAGATVAQDMRWSGMPLLLNADAVLHSFPLTVRHLAGAVPRPPIRRDDRALSQALSEGLDLWWVHLFYLRVIGAATALGIGVSLTVAGVLATARGLALTRVPQAVL